MSTSEDLVKDWAEVKESGAVYPSSSFTLFLLKTRSGKLGTGWVDRGYTQYKYKFFCPYNFIIKVDLSDSISENNPDIDMSSIEDFFKKELEAICTAHMVARVVTDNGMCIEMYIENRELAIQHLENIWDGKNQFISFTYEVAYDPDWAGISKLIKKSLPTLIWNMLLSYISPKLISNRNSSRYE
jgi:hypothetical protein